MKGLIFFLLGSEYEAFLTGQTYVSKIEILPAIVLSLQTISGTIMLITTLVLKIKFSTDSKAKGQKRNTISFNLLNIFYILSMFTILIPFKLRLVDLMQYAITLSGNLTLLLILISNEEARE